MAVPGCPLCEGEGGLLVHRGQRLRVVRAEEAGFPAFYRVVWNEHRAEFSDLSAPERGLCMDAVVAVEQALRDTLSPDKVNLAALGNVVPHLHWHVIARWRWDSHFPNPVWGAARQETAADAAHAIAGLRPRAEAAMREALASLGA